MVRSFTAALVAALRTWLCWHRVGAAGLPHAERVFAPNIQETERYCYMPLDVQSRILQQVSPCVTN